MQMTVDGYVAGPNDAMDWIVSSDDVWAEMFTDLASVDTFLMGRKMYPGYAGYWRSMLTSPTAPKGDKRFAQLADRTPHIVFSTSGFKPDWKNTTVETDIPKTIQRLKREEGRNIMVWGGVTLATFMMKHKLIDEFRLTINPHVLGAGRLLFSDIHDRKQLTLIEGKPLASGCVILKYKS